MKGTLAQKILARASGKPEVKTGKYVIANIDMAMVQDAGMQLVLPVLKEGEVTRVWDSSRTACIIDHQVPAPNVEVAEIYKQIREAVKSLGIKDFYTEGVGVSHQVMIEKGYVVPGELIVATDSHTTMYGALGAAGTGIGASEMAYVLATGKLWFKVPETIKFNLTGQLPSKVMSKDIILYIAGKYTSSIAQYKSLEFTGGVAIQMTLASRLTVSNMAMEIGAKFAFFEPDEKVENYLNGRARHPYTVLKADKDAVYEKVYQVNVNSLEPQIAFPYAVDNVKPISQIEQIKIDQAVLGSCTNGRLEDLKIATDIMKGKKVHPEVRFLVIPASSEVYKEALKEGVIATLLDSGAALCTPGCGPCYGGCMGLLASGESCIASINRNFKGRMGSPQSKVYLGSPATVAASALEGKITDPRAY